MRLKNIWKTAMLAFLAVLVTGIGVVFLVLQTSRLPNSINMSGMDMAGHSNGSQGTAVPSLIEPPSEAPVKHFDLTAQVARVDLGNGKTLEGWTFNGTMPGPELRVQQGDRVEVKLINNLSFSTSIHWHGVNVPNSQDGVAGVTQNAVKPGQSFTYSFIAKVAGTYWYHSHQDSARQVPRGLLGALIVEPKNATVRYDRDYTLLLHEFNNLDGCSGDCGKILTINGTTKPGQFEAKPGEMVRLRVINTGQNQHLPVLVGASAKVIALDGNDLNEPSLLTNTLYPVAAGQRFDLSFQMPANSPVTFIDGKSGEKDLHPFVTLGQNTTTSPVAYPEKAPKFDFTNYGVAQPNDPINFNSRFNQEYSFDLANHLGFYNGQFTEIYTINKQTFPDIPMITVQPGDLIKMKFTNNTDTAHPMHLHGHTFKVLTYNGKPLSGSSVRLDTIYVRGGDSYEIAFVADNPGLWMLHCHILSHAAHGMDMMMTYPGITTPYTIGNESGNHPE